MKSRFRKLAMTLVSASVLAALAAGPVSAVPNDKVDLISGGGSDTTYSLMLSLDRAFNESDGCINTSTTSQPLNHTCLEPGTITTENADHDLAYSYYPLGSSSGIKQLEQFGQPGVSRINYARSSRAPRSSDVDGSRFVAFAKDALTWVYQDPAISGSPVPADINLSVQEVKDIWANCTITNWSQVGGSSAPIIVWTSQRGSGTRASWDAFLGSGANSENCIPTQYKDGDLANGERVIFEHNFAPVRDCEIDPPSADIGPSCAAGEDKNSIYHYGFGNYQVRGGEDSLLGKINGVAPSAASISDNSFAFSRFMYNVYRVGFASNNAPTLVKDYMGEKGWICKAATLHSVNPRTGLNYETEITNIMTSSGFVRLPLADIGGGVTGQSHCRVTDTINVN